MSQSQKLSHFLRIGSTKIYNVASIESEQSHASNDEERHSPSLAHTARSSVRRRTTDLIMSKLDFAQKAGNRPRFRITLFTCLVGTKIC